MPHTSAWPMTRLLPMTLLAVLALGACAAPSGGLFSDVELSGPDSRILSMESGPDDIRAALAAGANPNVYGKVGRTPLLVHVCRPITSDSLDVLEALLSAGADPNRQEKDWSGGDSALHRVFKCNSDDRRLPILVARLLEGGADPNQVEVGTRTPLFTALEFSTSGGDARLARVVTVLLNGGASPNAHLESGNTPLHHLMCSRDVSRGEQAYDEASTRPEAIAVLLRGGADPNREKAFSGYYASEGQGHAHYDEDGKFAGEGGSFHYEDFHSGPPLSFACDPEAARLLIEAGADVGRAAEVAMEDGRSPVLRAMIDGGADPTLAHEGG